MKSSDEEEEEDGVEWLDEDASSSARSGAAVDAAAAAEEGEEEEDFEYSDEEQDDAEDVDWEDVAAAPTSSKQTEPQPPANAPESRQQEASNRAEAEELGGLSEGGDDSDDGDGDDDGDEMYEDLDEEGMDSESDDDDDDDDDGRDDEQTLTYLQKVNWEQVNQVLQQEALKAAKKQKQETKKRKAARMSKADKERELTLHRSHLLLLLATHLKWNALCQSPVLRGLLLSLTGGESAFDFYVEMKNHPLKYSLEMLVRWFNQHFRVLSASAAASAGSDNEEEANGHWSELLTESKLMRVFFERRGRDYELAVLFTALCRALRLYCRHTCALDALLVQQSKAFEATSASPSGGGGTNSSRAARSRKRSRTQSGSATTREEEQDASVEIASAQSFWVWTEVYDEKRKAWTNVDAIRKIVGQSREIESLRGKSAPFSYVVSITHTERWVDVTPRYAGKWSKSLRFRIADKWMGLTLEKLNAEVAGKRQQVVIGYDPFSNDGDAGAEDKLLAQEKQKLLAMTESEEMPTSIEGFKKHHLYCLERHLSRFECIYPRKAVGIFKGQPVFLRKHIQVTRSAYQWLRLGREVKESEREKPAKWYKKGKQDGNSGGAHDSDGDSDNGDRGDGNRDGARAMFGVWQTSAFVAPPVVNGVVPKNSYGNIELWSKAHVPRHAAHLRLPRIEKVAQQLGVDFAQAVVGFEVKNDRNVPKFDGIVVAETALEMLVDAHAHMQQTTIEKAIEKNQQLIAKRWERVVQRLLLRQRLEDDYGAVGSKGVSS